MKNRYFGDNKDLFKYDLVMEIVAAGLAERVTLVPMLTRSDDGGKEPKTVRRQARAGSENVELVQFLDECLATGKRDVRELDGFFKRSGIALTIYGAKKGYFTQAKRRAYFAGIKDDLLARSLVLLDPDIGLEVNRPSGRHLLFSEVNDLYQRMDESSLLMVYQNFPRLPHQEYLNLRMEELKSRVSGDYPVCIDDDEIAFFFLTKNEALEHSLIHLVGDYAARYSK